MEKSPEIEKYLEKLPEDRREGIKQLRETIAGNLPAGFTETISYGIIGYVVPHTLYPAGYHTDPKQPLPFINIASQKNHIALYHMGLYARPDLLEWFTEEYAKHSKTKLNMGKSCIRFKKPEHIPYELIAELSRKIKPEDWIEAYEIKIKK